jgi:hypothetical protein
MKKLLFITLLLLSLVGGAGQASAGTGACDVFGTAGVSWEDDGGSTCGVSWE